MEELAKLLVKAGEGSAPVFVRFTPDVLDFTNDDFSFRFHVSHVSGEFDFLFLKQEGPFLLSLLSNTIFAKNKTILCWDFKNFLSYMKFHFPAFDPEILILDLHILETYNGLYLQSPKNLKEALVRFKELTQNPRWSDINRIYKAVFTPLVKTLAKVETTAILNLAAGKLVYGFYEINGQENGRLCCRSAFKNCYVPHTLGHQEKENLIPRSQEELFFYFDFVGQEATLLGYLSEDAGLKECIEKGDIYGEIYQKVFQEAVSEEKRAWCKKIFIPMIYGQLPKGMSEILKINVSEAENIYQRVRKSFSAAFSWLDSCQRSAESKNEYVDVLGHRRVFTESYYRARNFAVHSPAALTCLEKLINLSLITDVAFHIHDGYVVYANKKDYKKVFFDCYNVLTEESALLPGLRFRVTCRGGRNLNNLKLLAMRKQ